MGTKKGTGVRVDADLRGDAGAASSKRVASAKRRPKILINDAPGSENELAASKEGAVTSSDDEASPLYKNFMKVSLDGRGIGEKGVFALFYKPIKDASVRLHPRPSHAS